MRSLTHCLTTGEDHNALSAFIITLMELKKKVSGSKLEGWRGDEGRCRRDGCFHTAMFGNGVGEKKQRINEMAAYYLARAVVFYLFSSTVCAFSKICIQYMSPACMYMFHAHPWKRYIVFAWFTVHAINFQSLVNDYLAVFLCSSCCQIH